MTCLQPTIDVFSLLLKADIRTVQGAFQRFLDQEINISRGTRTQASTSQEHLRDFLRAEAVRDKGFPRILRTADKDFLGGSFARHSKIWPLDDIDIYFPIDGKGLTYSLHGLRLAYCVLSDEIAGWNPLLGDPQRWMVGPYVSSKKLVGGFAEVLNRHYPAETHVRRAGEAANVQMMELGFDVVPCFSLRPDDASEPGFYIIPDGTNGWIRTNPRIDQEVSDCLQRDSSETFRPAVKLVKWWNKNRFGERLSSYYIELANMRAFLSRHRSISPVSCLSDAVALAFESVNAAAWAGAQRSSLPIGPPVERGEIDSEALGVLSRAAEAAREAAAAELWGNSARALHTWGCIFGPKFPIE